MYPGQAENALALQQAQILTGGAPPQMTPVVTGQAGQVPLPVTQISTQLQPDVRSGTSRTVETPEMVERREEAERAAQRALQASTAAAYGAAPEVVAAQPAPAVAPQPVEAPSGEGLAGGIPLMQTRPAQEEANRAAMAALAKEQADEELRVRARLDAIGRQRMEQAQANYDSAAAEYEAAKNPTTLKEEKGFALNILSAIAAAAGAYASIRSGAPNYALKIIEDATKADEERKRRQMENTFEAYKLAGKNLTDADKDKFVDTQMGRFLASQKAKLGQLERAANVALARFPDLQLKVQEAVAVNTAKLEEIKRQNIEKAGYVAKHSEMSKMGPRQMQQVPGEGGPRLPGMSDAEARKAEYGLQIKRAYDTLKRLPKPNDKDLQQFYDNVNKMKSASQQIDKNWSAPIKAQFLRQAGIYPASFMDGIKDPNAQEYFNQMLIGSGLIIRDESGAAVTNVENINTNLQRLPYPGEAPEFQAKKIENMGQHGKMLLRLAGPGAWSRLGVDANGDPLSPEDQAAAIRGEYDYGKLPTPPTTTGPRVPPEGQTPAQKRFTEQTQKRITADTKKPTGAELQKAKAKLSPDEQRMAGKAFNVLSDPKKTQGEKEYARKWLAGKGLL